jgi:hypothetical protein
MTVASTASSSYLVIAGTAYPPCALPLPQLHTCSFINRDDLDFASITSMAPVQEWDLQESNDGSLEYPTQ